MLGQTLICSSKKINWKTGYSEMFEPRNGFTVVELVITLIIVSILSAAVFARFLDTDTFNSVIVRDQIISMTRVAQQASLGRADVSLTIQPNSIVPPDEVTLTVSETNGAVQSVVLELDSVTLTGDINKLLGNQTPSCSTENGDTAITNTNPLVINFDELGDIEVVTIGGATAAVTSAVRLCLNNNDIDSVCVSPAGFAYAGSCDVDP
jgi:prepilin-type N-terminal cleavage/methylation domain-containing protein